MLGFTIVLDADIHFKSGNIITVKDLTGADTDFDSKYEFNHAYPRTLLYKFNIEEIAAIVARKRLTHKLVLWLKY